MPVTLQVEEPSSSSQSTQTLMQPRQLLRFQHGASLLVTGHQEPTESPPLQVAFVNIPGAIPGTFTTVLLILNPTHANANLQWTLKRKNPQIDEPGTEIQEETLLEKSKEIYEKPAKRQCLELEKTATEVHEKPPAVPPESPLAATAEVLVASHRITTPEAALVRSAPSTQNNLQNYISVRKSARRNEKVKKEEEKSEFIHKILAGIENRDKIQVREIAGKGRGLVAIAGFAPNEFVVEYAGELIDLVEAKRRERLYAEEDAAADAVGSSKKHGCYMYYFTYNNPRGKKEKLCVDATAETDRFGRLLNHSCKRFNLKTIVMGISSSVGDVPIPRLILRASRHIRAGEELLYDYGDHARASELAFAWLKE